MAGRRMVKPKTLLLLGAAVLVLSSAVAIFLAVAYSPKSGYSRAPAAPVTETSTSRFQPPPPPVLLPPPMPQAPSMG